MTCMLNITAQLNFQKLMKFLCSSNLGSPYVLTKNKQRVIKFYKLCDYQGLGFSSPGLSCGLCTQAVKYCRTVRTNKTRISMSLREKIKLKYGDIRGNLRATVWKDKQNVNTLPNMHHP